MKRVALALVFVSLPLGLAVAHLQAQGSQPPSRPTFASRADLVAVDVSVFDAQSRPVEGLRDTDFTVLVDGAPRRVLASAFYGAEPPTRSVPSSGGADRPPVEGAGMPQRREPDSGADTGPVPDPGRGFEAATFKGLATDRVRRADRRFVIVVDRNHIRAGEGQQALAAAARFVSSLPPSDRVAAWTLPGKSGRLSFDERRESVVRKVRAAVGVYRPPDDPSGPTFPDVILHDRHQRANDTIRSLRDLLIALTPIEGPKHVVLVSGGGMMDETNYRLVREVATLATASRTQIHALHVRPLPAAGARADLQALPCECRDERILMTGALGYELSLLTGGFADQPTAGLVEGAAFDRLARQLSAWYLLGFEPEAGDRDGRTHRIDVQVANRPGIAVRARRTFYIEPGQVASGTTPNPRQPDVNGHPVPFRLPEPGQEPAPLVPPPTLGWNREAVLRAQEGLLPFLWLPDWLDTTQHFCTRPELGPDVESVSRWDVDRLQSMTQWLDWLRNRRPAALRQWSVPAPAAAALLHTAAFIALVQRGDPDPLLLHLDLASSLLDPGNGPLAVEDPLRRLWYYVTPQWLLAYSRLGDALRLVNDGLRKYPGDADLHFLAGTLHEHIVSPVLDPYQFNDEERRRREQTVKSSLDDAARAFRRALELSPSSTGARLHLGRVLQRQHRPQEAVVHFERVLAESGSPEEKWLAHMFLGRVHERAGRTADAMVSYRRAFDILPSQTATIALAHALERTGDREAARSGLQRLVPLDGAAPPCEDACDPWQQYDLLDRQRAGALVTSLVSQACGAGR